VDRWRFALAAAALFGIIAGGLLVLSLVARDQPAYSASERYSGLSESRAIREDTRVEPTVPPIAATPGGTGTAATGSGSPQTTPTPIPGPAIYGAAVSRIRIGAIGVDAPLISLNLNPRGAMDVPDSPELVAWYDFTGKPGLGGNAVFSGHVDWVNYGPAVFWDLGKLTEDDQIEVVLQDGTELTYGVTALASYPVEELNMREILAPTARESVTLITCTGQFTAGSYTNRLVVRAVLLGVSPVAD